MADITNPQAIAFTNESIRPIAERVRGLKAEIDDVMIAWFSGINATIGSSVNDPLLDGREAEGVSRLTADDIAGLIVVIQSIQTTLDVAGITARVQKPCVRPLRVN